MKWMMTIAAAAAIAGSTVMAQSSQTMGGQEKMDHKGGMESSDVSYTGCLQASGSTFTLTHAAAAMSGSSMAHESMQHETMKEESMKPDTMQGGAMKNDGMKSDGMKSDGMGMKEASPTVALSSTKVNLRKHVGQRVSVTGASAGAHDGTMAAPPALVVTSVKVLAKSCS